MNGPMSFLILLLFFAVPVGLWYWSHCHKKKHGLKGAMGWLLFFNVSLLLGLFAIFGTAMQNLPQISVYFPGIMGMVLTYAEFFISAVIVSIIFYLIIWVQNNPKTPTRVVRLMWLGGPIKVIVIFVVLTVAGIPLDIPRVFTNLLQTVISAFIWSLYFKQSVRVKNTYSIPQGDAKK